MKIKEKVKDWVYEWLGRARSKKHIEREWKRHNNIALKSCEYIGVLLFLITLYFFTEGIFAFHFFLFSIFILYISVWAPDFLYLLGKILRNDKSYVPTHKRKFTHRYPGLISWAVFISVISLLLTDIFWCIINTMLAFIGYWLHLSTDKVESFVDRIAEFIETSMREKNEND